VEDRGRASALTVGTGGVRMANAERPLGAKRILPLARYAPLERAIYQDVCYGLRGAKSAVIWRAV
jgi:hypothetical protein